MTEKFEVRSTGGISNGGQKLLAMLSWLSEGQPEIVIAAGSQQIILASAPQCYVSALSYGELSDDDVINQTMEVFVA